MAQPLELSGLQFSLLCTPASCQLDAVVVPLRCAHLMPIKYSMHHDWRRVESPINETIVIIVKIKYLPSTWFCAKSSAGHRGARSQPDTGLIQRSLDTVRRQVTGHVCVVSDISISEMCGVGGSVMLYRKHLFSASDG